MIFNLAFAFSQTTRHYIIVDLPDSAALILKKDLGRISTWSDLWLVRFNPNKTESFLCSRKRNQINHPNLYLAIVPIKEVSTHKHLRLHLSNSCDWQAHIEYIKDKASSRLNLLRSLKFTLRWKSLEKIYFTFIRPILEYADIVYKHLRLHLSNSCDWQAHIEYIKDKASSRLNLLRSLKFTLRWKSLEKIYFTFIRPILEYADIVWDNCTQHQANEF